MSVVFYHLNFETITGGFTGVDVFFVISGYLITGIIDKEIRSGSFSFAGSYDRRIRRIFPALMIVIVASLVAGYVLLFPNDLSRLAEQSGYAALSLSNFYFYFNSDYFDPAASSQPLLHTWSLAVEEQFYVVWPILLVILSRFGRKTVVPSLLVLTAASFAISLYFTATNQSFAFYMLPTRAWELSALGGLLVTGSPGHGPSGELAPLLGMVMIGTSLVTVNEETPFPGWAALLPCVGAAAIIWPRDARVLADGILGSVPMVWLGKLSYSLYLWHWPVIFFANQLWPDGLTIGQRLGILGVSILLSFATLKAVETPFRRARPLPVWTLISGGASSVLIALVGLVVVTAQGFPGRLPDDIQRMLAYSYDRIEVYQEGTCFLRPPTEL